MVEGGAKNTLLADRQSPLIDPSAHCSHYYGFEFWSSGRSERSGFTADGALARVTLKLFQSLTIEFIIRFLSPIDL